MFSTGVTTHEKGATFRSDLRICDGHKKLTADKVMDSDYYVSTFAAGTQELNFQRLTVAKAYLTAFLL